MPTAPVSIRARKVSARASIIDVEGELTAFAESALMDAYRQASGDGVRAIILNFSRLTYMNSSGIGLLVTLLIRVKRVQQTLLAWGLSEHYRSIFQITRLDDAIGIYATEQDALRAAHG
jgi:anti-sigma B factor antagonist